jgi:hypothetical protein
MGCSRPCRRAGSRLRPVLSSTPASAISRSSKAAVKAHKSASRSMAWRVSNCMISIGRWLGSARNCRRPNRMGAPHLHRLKSTTLSKNARARGRPPGFRLPRLWTAARRSKTYQRLAWPNALAWAGYGQTHPAANPLLGRLPYPRHSGPIRRPGRGSGRAESDREGDRGNTTCRRTNAAG